VFVVRAGIKEKGERTGERKKRRKQESFITLNVTVYNIYVCI